VPGHKLVAVSPMVDPAAARAGRLPFAITVAGSLLVHRFAVVALIVGRSLFEWSLPEPFQSIPAEVVLYPPEPVPKAIPVSEETIVEPVADALDRRRRYAPSHR
jgi:hypothetical protein